MCVFLITTLPKWQNFLQIPSSTDCLFHSSLQHRDLAWFFDDPLPRRTILNVVYNTCKEANTPGNFTNHSLRATGTITLFDAGVPESVIQKRTGHRSLDALRCYERVTPRQQLAVSQILGGISQSEGSENDDELFLDSLPISFMTFDN